MSDSIVETEEFTGNNHKLKRRTTVREKVNETVEKSWRSVTTGLGKILETKFTNTLVIILLVIDIGIVVADLLIKLYKREYPEHYELLHKVDDIFYWIIFGLRTFYLFMIFVRVSSYGMIYLADPLNLFDAFIVIIAAVFFYIFKERDRVIASFFILCRFWRINRVLEVTEQKRKDKHEKNYKSLQRRMTTRLEGERNINAKLRKELEENNHNLDILMGGELVTNTNSSKISNNKGVKFNDSSSTNNKNNGSLEYNYLNEFENYFNF
ncbi:hypothetical protein BCR36DRAFT_580982 [Piromyces finnis]|uniref:Hydrogen voltage-gated channel 1 n=1 Tax=Piromyces finnis TaxID=1754191 RepID=A0A1Y1VI08_9FUNG|nr:hypothetical protein BCR36DRAFT_580982 [Piromyces finnis]|eukprot:ORX56669.1 hypothetical protein BCR36DRAFT_580982 [Piromyces finnis]